MPPVNGTGKSIKITVLSSFRTLLLMTPLSSASASFCWPAAEYRTASITAASAIYSDNFNFMVPQSGCKL